MTSPLLLSIITEIQDGKIPLPLVVSEEDTCLLVERIKGVSLENLNIREYIPDVFLFEREEEKESFSIRTVLAFIERIGQKPLHPPAIYILRDIDTAVLGGMNALLKVLEEPPPESVILLTVSQSELLLPTIASRTIFISENRREYVSLPEGMMSALERYIASDPIPLLALLYKGKYSREEALTIVRQYAELLSQSHFANPHSYNLVTEALITLESTNVNPRHVLDQVFLLSL